MRNLQNPGRSPTFATRAMAATSSTQATDVALDILKGGGNALDAAIAACAVQCVVEPGSTGIGGDNFCMYRPAGGDIVAYNGSGTAPAAASVEKFAELGITRIERTSGHSVVVPGAVDAWATLNRDHGRLPLADLLAPAVAFARDGYPVGQRVASDFERLASHIATDDTLASIFLTDGEAPRMGTIHRQPALARTLEAIGAHGRDAFYEGEIARETVEVLQGRGGLHTIEDFATYRGTYVTPISADFRGLTIHECPPNGQGVIALMMLNVISGFDTADDPISADRIHLELEVCRQCYRVRDQYVADPTQADVPVDWLLSEELAATIRSRIDMKSADPTPAPLSPRHPDTVYIAVVDADGNACSFINTLFEGFGSGITTPSGIVLTNRAQGFSLEPGHPNAIAGGKRPLHTIIPAIATDGDETRLTFGVMGGQYQAMGQMQFLTRHLDFGCDVQEAMDLPRFMADPFTGEVEIEDGVPDAIVAELASRGHDIARATAPVGGSQAIRSQNGVLQGGSDPRKDGCALGY